MQYYEISWFFKNDSIESFFCQVRKTRTMGDGCCTGFARCILVVFNIIFVVRKHFFLILHHNYLICFYSMIIHYQIMRQKWTNCGRSVKLSHLLSFQLTRVNGFINICPLVFLNVNIVPKFQCQPNILQNIHLVNDFNAYLIKGHTYTLRYGIMLVKFW